MQVFNMGKPWSYSSGFNRGIDFCLWALEQDGLRVPPFDHHPDGDGSLRAAGLDGPGWQAWLVRVVQLQEQQEQALAQRTRAPAPDVAADWQARLIPQAQRPALAWTGNAAVGGRLAHLWERYGPLSNQRQSVERAFARELHRADVDRAHQLYDALKVYQRRLSTVIIRFAAYPHSLTYLVPPVTAVITAPPGRPDVSELRSWIEDAAAGLAGTAAMRRRRVTFTPAPFRIPSQPTPHYRVLATPPAPPAPASEPARAGPLAPPLIPADEARRSLIETLTRHADIYGGYSDIVPATICLGREKAITGWRLYELSFDDEDGASHQMVAILQKEAEGRWRLVSASTSSEAGAAYSWPLVPVHDHPAILLSGTWGGQADGTHRFIAHGTVIANGFEVARVRLVNDAGQQFEDTVRDGMVLFATIGPTPVQVPMRAELYDAAGHLLWSEAVLDPRPPRWPR